MRKFRPLKVIACNITLVAFMFNIISLDLAQFCSAEARAGEPSPELTSVGPVKDGGPGIIKEFNIDTFALPEHLGQVKDKSKGSADTIVLHIQDAHCNYAAQHAIVKLMEHLNRSYGVSVINLEGGVGSYDFSIFTRIPDKSIREKVADDFVREGLVSGAEYYAINNPQKTVLWGVEDTQLYLENLNIYRDSLKHKEEVDGYLNSLSHIINNLKGHIFSDDLLEVDTKYTQYKAGNIEFKDYLTYLIQKAKKKGIDIKSYTNIYLLNQSLEQEEKIDFRRANDERDRLIDRLQKGLSKIETEELVLNTLEYKTEKLSQDDFYRYLIKKANELNMKMEDYPALQKYIVYVSLYNAVDKTKIMTEMDDLEGVIKGLFYENDTQKELNLLSKNLALTKNIFSISLTKEDYKYYKDNEESFGAKRFTAFIEKHAPLYKITATLESTIDRLDQYRENISQFYECSLKRDQAFIKNIKYPASGRKIVAMVTGGFHTDNLCKLFKDNNISYVSIMPNFRNRDEFECQYFQLLAGEMNSMEKKLYSAISTTAVAASSTIQIASMLSDAIAPEVWGKANIDAFRAAVLVDEQIAKGRRIVDIVRSGDDIVFKMADASDERMPLRSLLDAVHQSDLDVQMERLPETAFEDISDIGTIIDDPVSGLKGFLTDIGAEQGVLDTVDSLKGEKDGRALARFVTGVDFRAHAGGMGIRLNSSLKGNHIALSAAILHEIIAGYYGDHFLAQRIEQLYISGFRDRMILAGIRSMPKPVWDMTREERLGVDRDFAMEAEGVPGAGREEAIGRVAPEAVPPIEQAAAEIRTPKRELADSIREFINNLRGLDGSPRIFFVPVKSDNIAPHSIARSDIREAIRKDGITNVSVVFYDGTEKGLMDAYEKMAADKKSALNIPGALALAYCDTNQIGVDVFQKHNSENAAFKWVYEDVSTGVADTDIFMHVVLGLAILDCVKNAADLDHQGRLLDLIGKMVDNSEEDLKLLKADFENIFRPGFILKIKKIDINKELHDRKLSLEQVLIAV
jgi:hypothetical protein